MAKKLPGKGTLLKFKTGSPTPSFQAIAGRVKLDGPEPELKMRDVTDLDSAMVASAPAIPDPGSLSGTLFFDPNDATHIAVRARILAPPSTPDEWQLVYADGNATPATDEFKGYLTKFKPTGVEVEGTLQAEFEIRITDSFTCTAGTP